MTIKDLTVEHFPKHSHNPRKAFLSEVTGEIELAFSLVINSPRNYHTPTTINFGDQLRRDCFVYGPNLDKNYPPTFDPKITLRKGKFQLQFAHNGSTYILVGDNLNTSPEDIRK